MRQKVIAFVSGIDLRHTLYTYLLLTVGALILAINFDIFLAPAKVAPGGVSGVSIIINRFTGWPQGLIMLVLNIPLVILGFYHLGRFRFLVRTLYVVLIYSLGVDLLVRWLPPAGITDDLLLNALYGGVLGGLGYGLVFRGRGTSAGTGILGRVLQLKTGIPVSQIYIFTDGGVILALGLVFGWENALYALLMLFVWGLATDYVLEGPSVVRTAFIVTDSPQQVAQMLLNRLSVGVTAWTGRGMFTETEHAVLFCTVSRPDVEGLRSAVAEADPHAFVVVGQAHQASGGVLRHPVD
ncbi:MAG: YitT family protein [Anaerolineae bacterium]